MVTKNQVDVFQLHLGIQAHQVLLMALVVVIVYILLTQRIHLPYTLEVVYILGPVRFYTVLSMYDKVAKSPVVSLT